MDAGDERDVYASALDPKDKDFSKAGLEGRSFEICTLRSKAVRPKDFVKAELRLVGETIEGDDGDDAMVADLRRDDGGSRRPAGMFVSCCERRWKRLEPRGRSR